jgi:hypothetical protein
MKRPTAGERTEVFSRRPEQRERYSAFDLCGATDPALARPEPVEGRARCSWFDKLTTSVTVATRYSKLETALIWKDLSIVT